MSKTKFLFASTVSPLVLAYDNKGGWKLDASGNIERDANGDPIYLDQTGRERSLGPSIISQLNGEAAGHRKAREAAEARLAEFEGIDAAAARTALEKVAKLDGKELIDTGKVDELRTQLTQQFQTQIEAERKANGELMSKLNSMALNTAFASSEFVRDRLAIPGDMFQAAMARHFKVEDGKITPVDENGNVIYSEQNLGGVPASFDEALSILTNRRADKDMLLRAPEKGGSGGGNAGGRSQTRAISRAEFEKLDAGKAAEVAGLVRKGEMTLTD